MLFTSLFTAITLATASLAQSTRIQFSSVPGPFTIGKPTTISWTGGDSSPVTITLREGSSKDLTTIGIIASNLNTNNFTWTPSAALMPADDYALQISQGLDDSNYSGMFSIQSAAAGSATTIYAVAGSTTMAVSTVTPNATSTITLHAGGSSSSAASASGTGMSVSRNTTFSSQTLASTTTGTASVTSTATTTAGETSSSTGAAAVATAQAAMAGFGALAAAVVYLL